LVPISLPVHRKEKAELRWDNRLIADAMSKGTNRSECLTDISAALLEHEAAFGVYMTDPTPERHNKLLIEIIKHNGLKYYSAKAAINPAQEADRKLFNELLAERRAIKKQTEDLRIFSEAKRIKKELRIISKKLKRHKKTAFDNLKTYYEDALAEAHYENDPAMVHVHSRNLSFKKIGVKKRDYRSLATFRPSIHEWTEFLAGPGTSGGFNAEDVSNKVMPEVNPNAQPLLGVLKPQYYSLGTIPGEEDGRGQPLPPTVRRDQNDIVNARRDFHLTATALRKSKRRKAVPWWSAPAEMFSFLMLPNWLGVSAGRPKYGVGTVQSPDILDFGKPLVTDKANQYLRLPSSINTEIFQHRITELFAHARASGTLPKPT